MPATLFLLVDSQGGDVWAALQIGRLLRRVHGNVIVPKDGQCASACVFLAAGATSRGLIGAVRIHRPYDPAATATTMEQQTAIYAQIRKKIVAFLNESNVSASLYEDMLRIPPEQAKTLSSDDLERYGLVPKDPYLDEADSAKQAARNHISREELARRKARAAQLCPLNEDDPSADELVEHSKCHARVLQAGDE